MYIYELLRSYFIALCLFDAHEHVFRTKSVEFSGKSQDGNISMAF